MRCALLENTGLEKMNEVLFSVIVPLYNKREYIRSTLDSVLNQTVSSYELIVVDDGSTDGSPQIVEEYGNVRLIRQRHSGVSAARNRGIREARGSYICFLDADDTWRSDFLETVQALFLTFPDAGIACPSYQVAYGKRIVHPVWKSVDLQKDSYVKDFYEMATAPFWVMNSSCAGVKREILEKMAYWFPEKETVYEDFDFWVRLGTICRVAHSNAVCVTYQRNTRNNARETNRIIYSESYMKTLDAHMKRGNLTGQQRQWIQEMKDRRMVPYIFSLLLAREKKRAREVLSQWQPSGAYGAYKLAMRLCAVLPAGWLNAIQSVRMKVF